VQDRVLVSEDRRHRGRQVKRFFSDGTGLRTSLMAKDPAVIIVQNGAKAFSSIVGQPSSEHGRPSRASAWTELSPER